MLIESFKSHLNSGNFISKDKLSSFEKSLADIGQRKFAVGVKTGTDALFWQ